MNPKDENPRFLLDVMNSWSEAKKQADEEMEAVKRAFAGLPMDTLDTRPDERRSQAFRRFGEYCTLSIVDYNKAKRLWFWVMAWDKKCSDG